MLNTKKDLNLTPHLLGLSLILTGVIVFLMTREKKNKKNSQELEKPLAPNKKGWDNVDEASWESFPASDPPAH